MNKEESPYCEICGHCGEIGCCGIESFINNHIKGKTNCKNEDWVIEGIISICKYETEIFKENELLQSQLDTANKKLEEIENLVKTKMYVFSFNQMMILANENDYKELLSIIGGE